MSSFVRILFAAIILVQGTPLFAQQETSDEKGILYSRYFSPREYKGNPQNWAALQRENGTMVFANGDGVMMFDGARWQLIRLPNKNLVRSLAVDDDGRLYVGGYNEFGYILEDGSGLPGYVSLVSKLTPDKREPGHVWNILTTAGKVCFTTDRNMVVLENGTLREIPFPVEEKFFSTVFNDRILLQSSKTGLSFLSGHELIPMPDGDFYKGKVITTVLPFDGDVALIGTMGHGLYLFDGQKNRPFRTEIAEFLIENRLYKGIRLRNGSFALGTLNRGTVIIDKKGSQLQLIEKGRGLGDNAVYNLAEDAQGSLWVTMSVGISRVELQTPMTWFDERNGLMGAVNDITRYEDNIYAATMLGFFRLVPGSTLVTAPRFEKVKEIGSSVWAMAQRNGSLLLATDLGNVELKAGRYRFLDDYSGAVILASRHAPDIVYVGLTDGVVVLQSENGVWRSRGKMEGVVADVGEMNEDNDGNLWLGTFSEGAVQLEFPLENGKPDYLHPRVSVYGAQHGLPVGYLQIHLSGNDLVFRPEPHSTVYRFNRVNKQFEPFSVSGKFSDTDSTTLIPFTNESAGRRWLTKRTKDKSGFDFVVCGETSSMAECKFIPFSRVREDVDEVLFQDHDGLAWLGGLDGIVRFEHGMYSNGPADFSVIIDEIRLGNDSILYAGTQPAIGTRTFSYEFNTLAFGFGATSYDLHEENEYQYQLDGFDEEWSAWTKERSTSYTRIPEGNYRFRVRARNIYGDVSPEAVYTFSISPPWNRHLLAYIAYGLITAALVAGVVRFRSRQLERKNEELERIIRDRTAEISTQNIQLEHQAEELRTQTERLKEMDKIKSNFFTNISHEFRTPLTLILAPLEKKLQESPKDVEAEMMHRNGRRLQNLINQLLDLSKLEAGQMKIYLCMNDLTNFVTLLLVSFEQLAETRSITFTRSVPDLPVKAYFDSEKIETILYNLLSNAFKFTPEGGTVSFAMTTGTNQEWVEFSIRDTGPGIPAAQIPLIFDRFYQADGGTRREFEGSGIGLALTRELVTLMEGDINVTSEPDAGSTFTVRLPLLHQGQNAVAEAIAFESVPGRDIRAAEETMASGLGTDGEHTILLVEDNQDLRHYLIGILEKSYTVLSAGNGQEGLTLALDVVPDLIISDMMMPKMDGFTFCEEIRKHEATSHIPFILLTARSSIESRLAGLELGADDYLTKPFHLVELQTRIKNLLEQRSNLRKRFSQELRIAPKAVTVASVDEKFVSKVMEAVQANMGDPTFSVEMLSELVGMSRKNLHRKLVALTGQAPNEFIRLFRLKTARQLLEQKAGTVKEIAFSVGFNNLSYFSKCFREQFGVAPTEVI